MRSTAKSLLYVLALILILWVAAMALLPPSVFWSPDEGGRFLMLKERMAESGHGLPACYPGRRLDPDYAFYPSASRGGMYPRGGAGSGQRFNWSSAYIAVTAPAYRGLGVRGLYVPSLAGMLLCAVFAFLFAERMTPGAGPWAAAGVGLASPVFFYGLVFWEHAAAAGALSAGLFAVWASPRRHGRHRLISLTGGLVCLLAALSLRAELLIAATAAALVPVFEALRRAPEGRRRLRVLVLILVGLSVLCAAGPVFSILAGSGWSPFRQWDPIRALGAFLVHVQYADYGPYAWAHIFGVAINNPARGGLSMPSGWTIAAGSSVALCLFSSILCRRFRLTVWIIGAGTAALCAWTAVTEPGRFRAVHGLWITLPWLVAVTLPAGGDKTPGRRLFMRFCAAYFVLFVLVTLLLGKPTGGLEWGLRYGLPLYVFLGIAAAVSFRRFIAYDAGRMRRPVTVVVIALMLAGAAMNMRGVHELYTTKRELQTVRAHILRFDAPVVTDRWWLAAALAPLFVRHEMYTLSDEAPLETWLDLAADRVPAFLFIGGKDTLLPVETSRSARLRIEEWIETGSITMKYIRIP